jgi:integrase
MRQMQLGGIVPNITVREAIISYRQSTRFRCLANPATVNTGLNYWDDRLKGTRLVDLSGPRLARERNRLEKLKTTGATVCAYLSALSCAWAHAHEDMGAVPNGVTAIRWPKINREPPAKFTSEQMRHLLARADGYSAWPPLGLFVRLSCITTQRKGTVLGILWEWIDLAEGTIEVPRTKNRRALSLPIEGETLTLLRAHQDREKAAGRGRPRDFVFQSPKLHQPMEPKKHVDWLFHDPALDGKTYKHLRSTSLSRLFTHARLDVPRVMSISGHKTARVLLEHYAFADDDEKRKAIREHADMLLGR